MKVIFSLVLFKQSLDVISPLLLNINNFYNYGLKNDVRTYLSIYDNSPFRNNELSKLLNKKYIKYVFDKRNIGFGRAHNKNLLTNKNFDNNTVFIVVNPDITFDYIDLFNYLRSFNKSNNVCVAPLVVNEREQIQYSVKKNPTLLSLFIGRFKCLRALKKIDLYYKYHVNFIRNYKSEKINATYLSGCFLIVKSSIYKKVAGFDNRYFLHLEDADFTRMCSSFGNVLHDPSLKVVHKWARGSHKSLRQMICLFISLIKYFRKWGFELF